MWCVARLCGGVWYGWAGDVELSIVFLPVCACCCALTAISCGVLCGVGERANGWAVVRLAAAWRCSTASSVGRSTINLCTLRFRARCRCSVRSASIVTWPLALHCGTLSCAPSECRRRQPLSSTEQSVTELSSCWFIQCTSSTPCPPACLPACLPSSSLHASLAPCLPSCLCLTASCCHSPCADVCPVAAAAGCYEWIS